MILSVYYNQVLLRMLSAYYNHVRAFENTLVTKYYGLHCVKLNGQKVLIYMTNDASSMSTVYVFLSHD